MYVFNDELLTTRVLGYLSVLKALEHSAMRCSRKLNLVWIDADHLEDAMLQDDSPKYHKAWSQLTAVAGGKHQSSHYAMLTWLRDSSTKG